MNEYDEYNPYESMTDLLLTVLIIFILMLVILSLDVSKKITVLSKDNTYSGGTIRPILLVDPIVDNNSNKVFAVYNQESLYSPEDSVSVYGFYERQFLGMLSFIDPGMIAYNNKKDLLLKIAVFSMQKKANHYKYIINDSGEKIAGVNISYLRESLAKVWGNCGNVPNDMPINEFQVIKRSKVYYQSLEENGKQSIIIGHVAIDVSKDIAKNFQDIFNMLATSLTDFVYLGEFNNEDRLLFFEKYGGTDAVNYYREFLINSKNIEDSPLVKFSYILNAPIN